MIAASRRRLIVWSPFVLVLGLVMFWLFRPQPVAVDFAVVERGPLHVTVSDEGETRVRDMFVVSAPVMGQMQRLELEPGDEVIARKTVIARIEPAGLDVRSEAEARAALNAAEAARNLALATVDRATAELEFAQSELQRLGALAKERVISQNDLEAAQRRARTTTASRAEAQALVRVRNFEWENARARLLGHGSGKGDSMRDRVNVYSPVSGQVLRVVTESEGVVNPGTPLVEVGDPSRLEVVVDLLSTDAVNVKPGQRVLIEAWGGAEVLDGAVRRVEPSGFNKVSALGIEEQRVNVIVDFTGPAERWRSLGHGYRVEPRIVLWELRDAIKAPLSALFRNGDGRWATFVEEGGRAVLREVELGRQNGSDAQVLKGLEVGERLVLHPGERVSAGVRLTDR